MSTTVKNSHIIMLGTSLKTKGGISSVVNVYQKESLFNRHNVTYIETHCDGGKILKLLCALQALASFIKHILLNRVDFVHIHVASRSSFWRKSIFIFLCKIFKVPYILHLHGAEFQIFYEKECSKPTKRYVRKIFESAHTIIVLSNSWKKWMQEICPEAHIISIYNPVRVPTLSHSFESRKKTTLLFLGRLGKRKGVYDLLNAVAELVEEFPEITLLLGGDGDIAPIEREACHLGIRDRVKLLGWVSGKEKEELLRKASVYVLPSYNEGLPMSVLEAMAAGLPVVSTQIGGIPEAVTDGIEGRLIQAGDVNRLKEALHEILADQQLRRKMGHSAKAKITSTFSAECILPQLEEVYSRLTNPGLK